uniref:Uncharacterized protein n=1 Tax=Glossina morsitans morsitans TaxID=37546 RepID=A0ABK9NG69_GLOMM
MTCFEANIIHYATSTARNAEYINNVTDAHFIYIPANMDHVMLGTMGRTGSEVAVKKRKY